MIVTRLGRFSILSLFACLGISGTAVSEESCLDSLPDFRANAEAFYLEPDSSPFSEEFRLAFAGFTYFDGDEAFCIDASYQLSKDTKTIEVPTFNNETIPFKEHGVFNFELGGKNQSLTAYQRMDLPEERRQWVLVAFRDHTNGKETYGGGRYLEIELPIESNTILDLNRAANPFCAYQSDFACPMPPVENWLKERVPTGELDYVGNHEGDT